MSSLNTTTPVSTQDTQHRPFVPDVLSVPVYAVLTLISAAIALFFCFSVQIDHPSSSAVTVMIIANTNRAAMGEKSIARLIGTLIACVAMNTVFAHFVQAPWMFLITFALWMGLCVFVSGIAPTPSYAYAATMSAITVGIIAIQQMEPADIFKDSVDRFLVVSIGIGSVWLVFGLVPAILNNFSTTHSVRLKKTVPVPTQPKPVNWVKAFRGGLFTVFVMLIGCAFWTLTTWQDGSAMFLVYGIFTANLILADEVIYATLFAFFAVLAGILSAFLCMFFVLPYVNGFPMLMVALSIFLLPGFLIRSHPVLGALSPGFLSIVMSLISPDNSMNYNVTAYMNEALAFIIGLGLSGIAISVILPSSLRLPATIKTPSIKA
jgi:uncharacterized membrane protein YccC